MALGSTGEASALDDVEQDAVLDTVLDAMTDHEKLSLEVLDNETKSRAFALVILKILTQQSGLAAPLSQHRNG